MICEDGSPARIAIITTNSCTNIKTYANLKYMNQVYIKDRFYEILFDKWNEYLYRLKSGRRLVEVLGHGITSVEDLKAHMELFKIHMRGHNLYDIFYGRYLFLYSARTASGTRLPPVAQAIWTACLSFLSRSCSLI